MSSMPESYNEGLFHKRQDLITLEVVTSQIK